MIINMTPYEYQLANQTRLPSINWTPVLNQPRLPQERLEEPVPQRAPADVAAPEAVSEVGSGEHGRAQ